MKLMQDERNGEKRCRGACRKSTFYITDIIAVAFFCYSVGRHAAELPGADNAHVFVCPALIFPLMLPPIFDCWAAAFKDVAPDDAAKRSARKTVYRHAAVALLCAVLVAVAVAKGIIP